MCDKPLDPDALRGLVAAAARLIHARPYLEESDATERLRPDLAPCLRLPARLADFLAVRLVFDRAAAAFTADRLVGAVADTHAEPTRLTAVWAVLFGLGLWPGPFVQLLEQVATSLLGPSRNPSAPSLPGDHP